MGVNDPGSDGRLRGRHQRRQSRWIARRDGFPLGRDLYGRSYNGCVYRSVEKFLIDLGWGGKGEGPKGEETPSLWIRIEVDFPQNEDHSNIQWRIST